MSFETAFRQRLLKKIVDLKEQRAEYLLKGSAMTSMHPSSAGMNYAEAVGYLRGLDDVLRLCELVHDELTRS